jgi:geranylgeranyl reductase family protein
MPDFDAIVVGCGPGGNTVGFRLATAGAKVLMLERERLPRHKVCGGGLSRKTLREIPFPVTPVVEREIAGVYIAYRGSQPIYLRQQGIGAMVQRSALDAFMTGKAAAAGAALWEGCAYEGHESRDGLVSVSTDRGTVTARVLVGADGVHSRVRKQLYPDARPMIVPAIEGLLIPAAGVLEQIGENCIFDLGIIPAGYAWVFPKGDHLNIGLYRFAKRRDNHAMKALLESFIKRYRILRDRREVKVRAFVIPVRPVGARLATDRVILVGDAAGVGEAFYGEGIYYAVRSGNLAADAILGNLKGRAPLSGYDRAMQGLRRDLFFSRLTARVFYASPRLGFQFGVRTRRVSDLFAGVIAGTVRPGRCLLTFLLLAPYWLLARKTDAVQSPLFD